MSGEQASGDRTEAPTAKRLDDAVKRGDIWQSRDLGTAMVMAWLAAWLVVFGGDCAAAMAEWLADALTFNRAVVEEGLHVPALPAWLADIALLIGGAGIAAVVGPVLLGARPRVSGLAVRPARLNPVAGMRRMLGPSGWIELAKAVAKVTVLGGIAAVVMGRILPPLWRELIVQHPAAGAVGAGFVTLTVWLAAGLALIAMVDAPVQWLQRQRRLRMTKQEVRDEQKQTEGAPERKGAQRARHQAILMRSARRGMQQATVVVTNPSHFAVGLRYRPGQDQAPIIVARGCDAVAAAIRAMARDGAKPVVEQPLLARALYFSGTEGAMIDPRLYHAVALVLAFVARLDAWKAGGVGTKNPSLSVDLAVPPDLTYDSDGRLLSDEQDNATTGDRFHLKSAH